MQIRYSSLGYGKTPCDYCLGLLKGNYFTGSTDLMEEYRGDSLKDPVFPLNLYIYQALGFKQQSIFMLFILHNFIILCPQ